MPGSYANKLLINNNEKIYCFWYRGINNGTTFYRYLENNIWSETICPYPGNFYLGIAEIKCDDFNNLHCIGAFHNEGQSHYENRIFYSYYDATNVSWSIYTAVSDITYGNVMMDIDLDNVNFPHIAYRQKTPMTGPGNDSTLYRYFDGNNWTTPELIVEDPKEQKIIIDNNNKPNIFDREKEKNGYKLLHYFKYDCFSPPESRTEL